MKLKSKKVLTINSGSSSIKFVFFIAPDPMDEYLDIAVFYKPRDITKNEFRQFTFTPINTLHGND